MTQQAIKNRVVAEIKRCQAVLADQGIPTSFPEITYSLRGTTAGTANSNTYTINLNMQIMIDNLHSIEDTTAHEFAHLVDAIQNPETRQRRYLSNGRISKRSVHGPTWKALMVLLGRDESRTHNLNVDNARVKRKATRDFVWVCGCGEGKMELSAKQHKKQLVATSGYGYYAPYHKPSKCGNYVYQGLKNTTPQLPIAANSASPKPKTNQSKIARCREAFDSSLSRGDNITNFVALGCTKAGAATYYATIKKEQI